MIVVRGTIFLLLLLSAGCVRPKASQWGEAVDPSQSRPLSRALHDYASSTQETVTLSGRITEVCRSSGCWFVLADSSNGHEVQLYVDLTHGATFTVSPEVLGRPAVVKGRIVGEKPDLKFHAVGLRILE